MYITEHSKATVVCMEDCKQLAKYAETNKRAPSVRALVVWGGEPINPDVAAKCGVPVYSWEDFLNLGSGLLETDVTVRGDSVRPGNCSTPRAIRSTRTRARPRPARTPRRIKACCTRTPGTPAT